MCHVKISVGISATLEVDKCRLGDHHHQWGRESALRCDTCDPPAIDGGGLA